MVKDKLPLTTLCLITTHKCTSACPNCGFFCSPKQNNSMTIDSMLHYIDKSKTMFPSIYCLVLTGGEISCYKNEDIAKVITFAKSKGIINTRIVSNAAWAKNLEAAKKYLLPLIQAGLTELNISTGDEHSMFVPINNVLNAIKAAYDNGIYSSIALEKHKISKVTSSTLKDNFKKCFSQELPCQITESSWIELKSFRKNYKEDDFCDEEKILHSGCNNMFTGIQINPSGQLLACCGFAAEFSEFLKLGHIDSYKSAVEYENNLYNLLNIWLFAEGPTGIIEHLAGKSLKNYDECHMCEHCLRLMKTPSLIEAIKKVKVGKLKEIIVRYEANRAHNIVALNKQTNLKPNK